MREKSRLNLPTGDSFLSLLSRIVLRVWRHGPFWLPRRAVAEIRSPLTRPGRLVNAVLRWAAYYCRIIPMRHRYQGNVTDTLIAFYDLLVEPNTFDVMWFLLAAERQRQLKGLRYLHVVFVGSASGMERVEPPDYQQNVSSSSRRDRIVNVLVPQAYAMPSVGNVEILNDRREARVRTASRPPENIFPRGYSVDLHRSCIIDCYRQTLRDKSASHVRGAFRAGEAALAYVERWLAARNGAGRAVSITIRNYGYNPARNSNLAEWGRFADYLTERGYFPIFIPDAESLAEGLAPEISAFPHFIEAAWNLNLRMALYECAFLNLGINNGPTCLFLLNDRAKGIIFKILTPSVLQTSEAFLTKLGFTKGEQISFCTPFQRFVWEDDDFDVIKREFEEMERRIYAQDGTRISQQHSKS